ncbi:MAG: glycosyltransferase family 2 protein [Deltaproteobacteria bacterium]|nr:glycosyltransferase family 2 protein [Deltaproteobacteria bacterium]MCK5012173.1 glycosyltransferase family 2 protein [Deltaproteobacteria bacterium]MCK5256404.1 glycosyltransferase family 2 protein [Deltaproteobacteria bacterium]NOQ86297.1 glycosyltransferase [Deltaproteobacteria bacterium]
MNKAESKISIVIPTLDEEDTIAEIIEGCKPYGDEILVVDGHSRDRTREVAENLGVKVILDNKKGKGEALRHVVNFVNGNIIVFIDADGSHDPKDIPKLVEPIIKDEADHVSGSRLIGGSSELHGGFDECFRLMGSSFITACINWRFKVKLSESQNGFRAIKTDIIKQLGLEENITTIEQEMIMKTLKNGFRMAEVPSHEYERKKGYSKISLKKVWFRYVYTLVKYLFF